MKYILAISGGVDSVVLLDMVVRGKLSLQGQPLQGDKVSLQGQPLQKDDVIVAHFDHGLRPGSAADAQFVKNLAAAYQIEFRLGQGQLVKNASEQSARVQRYEFLHSLASNAAGQSDAADVCRIVTAHHQDDLLETIVMNLIRGTGWRGLAPMSSRLVRPLIGLTKAEIVSYAIHHQLEWVEDESNFDFRYFRNRVRNVTARLDPKSRRRLLELAEGQATLRQQIDHEIAALMATDALDKASSGQLRLSRYHLIMWPSAVAIELIRRVAKGRLTRPQQNELLLFSKVAAPGKQLIFGQKLKIIAKKRHILFDIC
jgi:tRNA(Ile)-lysidine synthase